MPYYLTSFLRRLAAAASSLALLGVAGVSPSPSEQVHLAWRAPAQDRQYTAAETVNHNVAYQMSGLLRAMAGKRADPIFIVEERTRTLSVHPGEPGLYVTEEIVRRRGGEHPVDTTVKRRERRQIIAFDPSGRFGLEERLCKGEPALDDSTAKSTAYKQCAASDPADAQPYEDPGDGALAEFPVQQPIAAGTSWTFARPVRVARDLASGKMTYVDTFQHVELRNGHHIAIINVAGTGRIDAAKDLQSRGFHAATMTLAGNAEFDVDEGIPGAQHYTGHVEWHTRVLGAHIGIIFDEVYDGKPWTIAAQQ